MVLFGIAGTFLLPQNLSNGRSLHNTNICIRICQERRIAIMQMNPAPSRGRFIAPTADLSALRGCSATPTIVSKLIIAPTSSRSFPHLIPHCTYLTGSHTRNWPTYLHEQRPSEPPNARMRGRESLQPLFAVVCS